jgi:ribonuclease HI
VRLTGQVPQFTSVPGPVVAATDASLDNGSRTGGLAYITSNGYWGIQRCTWPAGDPAGSDLGHIEILELRAVAELLTSAGGQARPLALVLVDSSAALRYLKAWRDGGPLVLPRNHRQPPGALYNSPRLARLARCVSRIGSDAEFRKVPGHSGHPLNAAADRLAHISRTSSIMEMRAKAERSVGRFLDVWHQA